MSHGHSKVTLSIWAFFRGVCHLFIYSIMLLTAGFFLFNIPFTPTFTVLLLAALGLFIAMNVLDIAIYCLKLGLKPCAKAMKTYMSISKIVPILIATAGLVSLLILPQSFLFYTIVSAPCIAIISGLIIYFLTRMILTKRNANIRFSTKPAPLAFVVPGVIFVGFLASSLTTAYMAVTTASFDWCIPITNEILGLSSF